MGAETGIESFTGAGSGTGAATGPGFAVACATLGEPFAWTEARARAESTGAATGATTVGACTGCGSGGRRSALSFAKRSAAARVLTKPAAYTDSTAAEPSAARWLLSHCAARLPFALEDSGTSAMVRSREASQAIYHEFRIEDRSRTSTGPFADERRGRLSLAGRRASPNRASDRHPRIRGRAPVAWARATRSRRPRNRSSHRDEIVHGSRQHRGRRGGVRQRFHCRAGGPDGKTIYRDSRIISMRS
jgi:hypothetical protein